MKVDGLGMREQEARETREEVEARASPCSEMTEEK